MTGRWPRLRRWARRAGTATMTASAVIVAVWVAVRAPWTEHLTLLGYAILTAPLYGFAFWVARNRGWLIDQADEASDTADRAHERIDALGERQRVTHDTARHALTTAEQLRRDHGTHRHPVPEPTQRPQERPARAPATTELPRVRPAPPGATQPVPEAHTTPRGIDLAGGARTGSTASRGRHAAPDHHDRQAGAQ